MKKFENICDIMFGVIVLTLVIIFVILVGILIICKIIPALIGGVCLC